jgi:hypothetical protein
MGSVAAQVMAWQRRARNLAGPLTKTTAPTGDSPSGAVLQVELLVDGLWTDITSRVMTRSGNGTVAITRGEPNEGAATQPASCQLELQNRDGLFSTRNPASPYFGKLARNQPLRVSVPSGNAKSYRFWGEVAAWPQSWDPTGTDVGIAIEAAGILRRLGQGTANTGSTLYTAITSGALSNPLIAYWPCEDATNATSLAAGIPGVLPMRINGTITLASNSSFVCSLPLPNLGTQGNVTGFVPAYTPQMSTMVRFLVAIPSSGATDGQVLCSIYATGSIPRWDLYYSAAAGGLVGLRGRNSSGTTVFDTGTGGFSLNGQLAQLSAELVQTGPDIQVTLYTMLVGSNTAGGPFGTASSQTVGAVTSLLVGGALSNTAIGHIRVQIASAQPTDQFDLQQQLIAYAGESAAARVARLCATIGVAYEQIGNTTDGVAMGTQLPATPLSLIDDCQVADDGILYESTSMLGLGYRTRVSMENQAPALTLDYRQFELAAVPSPVDDDRYARNDITVKRSGGSSARAVQATGPLSILPPPAGVGLYPDSVTVNIVDDSTLTSQAGWRLHLGTVDEARYPQIAVNLAHQAFVSNPALRQQVLAVRPGDRITIANPPAWLPPDQISQIVIGFSEQLDRFQHRITFNTIPESPYHTALLEDPVLSRLDTGGSQLASSALATDTTLLVATTYGPLWTTSAADWPFDIRISGEQITVTAVSGSSSPQTLTVTRGVNGVTKPLPIGADVRLNQPMTLAL